MFVLALAVLVGVGIYGSDFVRKWRVRGAIPIASDPMFVFRVIGPDGKPVVGAHVASGVAGSGSGREYYWWGRGDRLQIVTDDEGYARIPVTLLAPSVSESNAVAPVYVCQEERGLVAIVALKNRSLDTPFDVDAVQGCHVSVVARGGYINFRGARELTGGVYVKWGLHPGSPIMQGTYQAQGLLPPGPYVIDAFSSFTAGSTQSFDVAIGQKKLVVRVEGDDEVNTRLAGQIAPTLEDIRVWSQSPMALEDLRGNVVILHFWNSANTSAVAQLQELVRLGRRFDSAGLRVVAIHDHTLKDAAALDTILHEITERSFDGQALPFSVGLDTDDVFELEDGVKAYGRNVAAYGGLQTLLIDRRGTILRRLDLLQSQATGSYVYSAITGEASSDRINGIGMGIGMGNANFPAVPPIARPAVDQPSVGP